MSEPEDGGETVFLSEGIGLRVKPQLGGALFWWDHFRSGEPDHRTLHGGCPLLRGKKWGISTMN